MAQLLSVNVGMPKDVSWHDRTVHTGIWKTPVDGPVTARRLNLDGDGQGDLAGHGGEQRAVLVYQAESIAYWREQLGSDGSGAGGAAQDFGFGVFGENFTVDGLPDDEVCIGDRYRIGQAEFEVTQPRVTCYRLGLRLDAPTLPALLVEHGRPGFYLRVITEGQVRAGDAITRTRRGPHALTVARIDALLYLPNRDRRLLEAAVDIPALSPGWRQSFQDLLAGSTGTTGATGAAPAWSGFRPLCVAAVVPESSTITSLHLAAPDRAALPPALPGQYLTVRVPGPDGAPAVRSYSLSSAPGSDRYRISVKREGAVSAFLSTRVRAGMSIEVAAPRGEFVLAPGTGPVLLISAGVGVTPVLAMLHQLAAEHGGGGSGGREVWWLHTARDAAQQAFAREAHALLNGMPAARELVFHTAPADPAEPSPVPVSHARLTARVLAELGLPSGASAYLCGPERFMADTTKALVDLGLDARRVHTELFGTLAPVNPGMRPAAQVPPHPPAGEPGTGPLVTFARSGLSARWNPATTTSLLELAEACDVPTRWSCRTGVCHTCVTEVLSGRSAYRPEPLELPATGTLLICCSRPASDLVLDL
ncbi:MOSC and FAD-binding oxidoreductase domain-containing protein [Kitasatospora sp. NBC_01302]|uniref:MOSC and FAD-binding oxidoreductase domain-containing protein n=1 Tax=Kitasatospora sp. NBC_01302 TaxID=2903575 RepID=UPI002E12134E|nr:MOSC and FAD-binding oxidoreductase domain-containing protein [Kitasatospora sp. NBC_01302]